MRWLLLTSLLLACGEAAPLDPPPSVPPSPPVPVSSAPPAPSVEPPIADPPIAEPAALVDPVPPAPTTPPTAVRPSAPFDRELHPLAPDAPACIEMISVETAGGWTSSPVYIDCGTTQRVGREVLGCVCP